MTADRSVPPHRVAPPRAAATLRLAMAAAVVFGLVAAAPALDAVIGRAVFERVWVGGGASTRSADGLGPLHNARSCAGCHPKGGGALVVADGEGGLSGPGLVVRLAAADGAPDPVYGHQIQTRGLVGQSAEARVAIAPGAPAPGEAGPRLAVSFADLGYGPLDAATHVGLRLAPPLFGRAAFDRVDAAAVLARADPDDADGDGISGRARLLPGADGAPRLGRYGWRAAGVDLAAQVASAFSIDLGLSTPQLGRPAGDCTPAQPACLAARHGDADGMTETEVTAEMMGLLTAYLAALPAPRPADDPAGAALFAAAGCGACHVPRLSATGGGEVAVYTDLLLHDLGPGLADPAADPGVGPAEWRTAPLIGLSAGKAGRRRFLHDGRAGSIEAAVLWHDGEAAATRARFEGLASADRAALLAFLARL